MDNKENIDKILGFLIYLVKYVLIVRNDEDSLN